MHYYDSTLNAKPPLKFDNLQALTADIQVKIVDQAVILSSNHPFQLDLLSHDEIQREMWMLCVSSIRLLTDKTGQCAAGLISTDEECKQFPKLLEEIIKGTAVCSNVQRCIELARVFSKRYMSEIASQVYKASMKITHPSYPLLNDIVFQVMASVLKSEEVKCLERYAEVPRVSEDRGDMAYPDFGTTDYQWWCSSQFAIIYRKNGNSKRCLESNERSRANRVILKWIDCVENGLPIPTINIEGCQPYQFIATVLLDNERRVNERSICGVVLQIVTDIDLVKEVEGWTWAQVKRILQTIEDIASVLSKLSDSLDGEVNGPRAKLFRLMAAGTTVFNLIFNAVAGFWQHGYQQRVLLIISEATNYMVSSMVTDSMAESMDITSDQAASIARVIKAAFYRVIESENQNQQYDEYTLLASSKGYDHYCDLCSNDGVNNVILSRCEQEIYKLLLSPVRIALDQTKRFGEVVREQITIMSNECRNWIQYLVQIHKYAHYRRCYQDNSVQG